MTAEQPRADRAPTMKSIAAHAGVGLGTVSRVLSNDRYVADATRKRVEQAIKELGYRPSAIGRGLKRQRTDTIGLIVADIANPFYGEFAQGVLATARQANRHVIVGSSNEDAASEFEYIELMLEQRVAGIIAFPTGENIDSWRAAISMGVRVLFADRTLAELDVPSVVVDNVGSSRTLTEHLLQLGHSRVGYLGGPVSISSGRLREQGYREALRAAGIPVDERLIVRQTFTRDSEHANASRLLDLPQRPTAVVASNNLLGEAMLAAARERGLSIPDELSVAMFDDVPWAGLTHPAMTVLAQPVSELGRRAAELISGESAPVGEVVLPTRLIVRESTRAFS